MAAQVEAIDAALRAASISGQLRQLRRDRRGGGGRQGGGQWGCRRRGGRRGGGRWDSGGERGEEGKGNELVKNATPLFKASKLNYFGNVEGKEVIGGKVDVAVTDGFTGNVMLKSSEAVAKLITDKIREIIKNGSILTKIGGLLVMPALGAIKKLLDPNVQGAAPLLGVNGLVFIGHGRSDAIAIKNAVRVAKHAVDVKVLDAMKSAIEESLQTK